LNRLNATPSRSQASANRADFDAGAEAGHARTLRDRRRRSGAGELASGGFSLLSAPELEAAPLLNDGERRVRLPRSGCPHAAQHGFSTPVCRRRAERASGNVGTGLGYYREMRIAVGLGVIAGCAGSSRPPTTTTANEPCGPVTSPSQSVEGTSWSFCGDTAGGGMKVSFEPGEVVTMSGRSMASERLVECGRGSRWMQTGSHIVFDCNGFTIYEVEIEGDRLLGQWHRNPKMSDEQTRGEHGATCLMRNP
jgi:hypothetical protein